MQKLSVKLIFMTFMTFIPFLSNAFEEDCGIDFSDHHALNAEALSRATQYVKSFYTNIRKNIDDYNGRVISEANSEPQEVNSEENDALAKYDSLKKLKRDKIKEVKEEVVISTGDKAACKAACDDRTSWVSYVTLKNGAMVGGVVAIVLVVVAIIKAKAT